MPTSIPADAPLNPYQPPADSSPPAGRAAPPGEQPETAGPLRFWEGRKALLQSLFYMRCFVVLTAVVALRAIYRLLSPLIESTDADPFPVVPWMTSDPWLATFFVLAVVNAAFSLVLCYVIWQYAASLQAIAGRHESDPTPLCRRHLLCWRLKVAAIVLVLADQGLGYLYSQALFQQVRNSTNAEAESSEDF